jgi:hypothetical protein
MKMKRLVGASLLFAAIAVVIYFSTRSRNYKVEPAKASQTNEAGWRIGLYQVGEGKLTQFGDGVARTNEATGKVLLLDIGFNTSDSQSRMVVNDEGPVHRCKGA